MLLTDEERKNFEIDPMIKFCFDYILPITKDRLLATHGGSISLADKQGNLIVTFDSIELIHYDVDPPDAEITILPNGEIQAPRSLIEYVDDLLKIRQDGLWGLIDMDGNILLEPMYNELIFTGPNTVIAY